MNAPICRRCAPIATPTRRRPRRSSGGSRPSARTSGRRTTTAMTSSCLPGCLSVHRVLSVAPFHNATPCAGHSSNASPPMPTPSSRPRSDASRSSLDAALEIPLRLVDRFSGWWHQFTTARWYAATVELQISPRFRNFWLSSKAARATASNMRLRQIYINEATDNLKALMMVPDPQDWDNVSIEREMTKMHQLLRAQEGDGRDILAAAVAFGSI